MKIPNFLVVLIFYFESTVSLIKYSNSTFIAFDPYVYILDKENRYRYNINDLQPLISKVAKDFNKIFIEFTEEDLNHNNDKNTSLSLSPSAIAHFNKMSSNQSINLEVWLSYSEISNLNIDGFSLITQLGTIANNVNKIFNGTVTTILFSADLFFRHITVFTQERETVQSILRKDYQGLWGYVTLASACESNAVFYKDLLPDVILLSYSQEDLLKTNPSNLISVLKSVLNDCRKTVKVPNSSSFKMGIMVSIPDTYSMTKMHDKNRINMARLVATWGELRRWSESTGTMVVLSKAFDTPYKKNVQLKTDGWWRLKEGLQYQNFTEFQFEAKNAIAKSVDLQENTFNLSKLTSEVHSSKLNHHVGIILSLFDEKRYKPRLSDDELQPILQGISNKFNKAMILLDDDTQFRRINVLYELQALSQIKDNFNEIIAILLPNVNVLDYFPGNVVEISKKSGVAENLISTYIVSFTGAGNETKGIVNYIKRNAIGNGTIDPIKFGYAFNISICGSFDIIDEERRNSINQTPNYDDAQTILFYFEEDVETVKLGAGRMFNQRTAIFEYCVKIVAENKKANSYKLGFVLLHYATHQSFYEDPWALQNFVRYCEMLSQWADMTKTTVIAGNVLDGTRVFKAENRKVRQVGWWRHQPSLGINGWIDKTTDAIRAYEEKQGGSPSSGDSDLNATHIVLIAIVPFLICALVGISAVLFVRRYYKEVLLSKEEIEDFLHGARECKDGLTLSAENDNNEYENEVAVAVYKLPYDKSKYEIASQHFSVDNDGLLGSGEFGTVCRGKVQNDKQGTIHVAVKIANPNKFHKTALTGMLSEIKMLAYIGKHENINEMIGANTADLKHGKVFIFLELCQLGCLEKYLRKLRPTITTDCEVEERTVALDDGGRYINMTTCNSQQLDPSLCEDFYRWSKEICNGMAYLATKHVVHADLASRNVLLNWKKEAKLCDFGLSRRMYNYTNYVKQKQEPLPWKWMSPEALRLLQFNEKSDVWAYGVTLWEIYSLGDQPYPGLSWDVNFPTILEQGLRLGKPKYDDRNMYMDIMRDCWKISPDSRPSFADLATRLTNKLA